MASWSSESHSSSGGTDCSLMNTASRMRRSSALSFCQSAMRTLTSFFIGKLQASLFDQLDQQGTGFVVAQPLVKIIPMQGIGGADQLEQVAQVGRQQAALAAGEQQQAQVDLAPCQARAGVAHQHRAVLQRAEQLFLRDLRAADQLGV